MARKKKVNLEPEIEEKLKYIGLSLDNISPNLQEEQPLNYRVPRDYDENQYKQYRYIPVSKISILLTPTNRLDELEEKYRKATPLIAFLDNQSEESSIRHSIFLNMLKQLSLEDLEKLEKEQQKLSKNVPFRVKYENNYLWQIYYAENTDRYFMLVPTGDTNYTAFFYLLKKKLENKSKSFIYAPISGVDYSRNYFKKSEFKDIGNYLELFAKEWPYIYEVYNKQEEPSIYIVGETYIYGKIKSDYKVKLSNKIEATKFFKLVKALFIVQSELPNYYEFQTRIDKQGSLEFYYNDQLMKYDELSNWVNDEYRRLLDMEKKVVEKNNSLQEKLSKLKKQSQELDIEYLSKEKQISTFLECKKTFFGKVKYFFKYSGKKNKVKEKVEKTKVDEIKIVKEKIEENLKVQYTLEELIQKGKETLEKENNLKNTKMDINALKLKNLNLTKKIENATAFIEEIDSHKKSIFEFWKYSNKDEVNALAEGEKEVVNVKPHAKTFEFEEDFEEFGITMDHIQRAKLNKEELDSIYLTTTNQLTVINKVKTNSLEPKELDKYLKELKAEQKKSNQDIDEEIDIFGNLEEDTRKTKKLANKSHRENPKNKFLILGLGKQYKVVDYKVNISQVIWRVNDAINKISTSEDIVAYMWTDEDKTIDANEINVFNLDAEYEIEQAIKNSESSKINLYKIKLEKGAHVIAFSNCVYFDNQNKTLPEGMDKDTRIMVKLSDMDIKLNSKKNVKIGKLENDEITSKLDIKTVSILEYTVKQMEEE